MELLQDTDLYEQLLQARESRQQCKLSLVGEGYHLVSLQLNVPGLPKADRQLAAFIRHVDEAFGRHLLCYNANYNWLAKRVLQDVAGDSVLYLFNPAHVKADELKELTEAFEQQFVLGRIVDLDVLSVDGVPVSSGKAKGCFLCERNAEECRKTVRHSIVEVREAMVEAITNYLKQQHEQNLVLKVAGFALQGLMHEVALSPKPGLVCRNSSGAHTDMDYGTFIKSIAAISPYFNEIGSLAIAFQGTDVSKALPLIKNIGLRMEQAMFSNTINVNTHKGAVFLMALSCFAVVRVVKKQGWLKLNAFSSVLQQLTRGLVQRELCAAQSDHQLTHGQQCFLKYGLQAAGARGEVEQGMPTVLFHALPYLSCHSTKNWAAYSDLELGELLIPVLLKIMSVNNDTNIIYRHGRSLLEQLKQKAKLTLTEWEQGNHGAYYDLVNWCNDKRLSPGGSADLLAVTITLHLCQTEYLKGKE